MYDVLFIISAHRSYNFVFFFPVIGKIIKNIYINDLNHRRFIHIKTPLIQIIDNSLKIQGKNNKLH